MVPFHDHAAASCKVFANIDKAVAEFGFLLPLGNLCIISIRTDPSASLHTSVALALNCSIVLVSEIHDW